jgi:hypothetical protein
MKNKQSSMKYIKTSFKDFVNENVDNLAEWFEKSEIVDSHNNPLLVYHFTNSKFDVFDITKARKSGFSDLGFWFGSDEKSSSEYGRIKKECYIKIKNGYYLNDWEELITHIDINSKTFGNEAREFREYLINKNYDGVIIENASIDGMDEQTIYVVFDNSQILCINK